MTDFLKGGVILTGDAHQTSAYGTGSGDEQNLADNALKNNRAMEKIFLNDIAKGDVAAARALIDQGMPLDKADMATKLQDVLKSHNADLGAFLIENGALEGYGKSAPVTEKEKVRFLFDSIGNDNVSPKFLSTMQSAFNIHQEDTRLFIDGANTKDQQMAAASAFHVAMHVDLSGWQPYQQPETTEAEKAVPVHVNFGLSHDAPPAVPPQVHDIPSLGTKLVDSGVTGATPIDSHPVSSDAATTLQKTTGTKSRF